MDGEQDRISSGLGRFRPGPPNLNNALLRAGHYLFEQEDEMVT